MAPGANAAYLITRAEQEGSKVFLECLEDRALWNATPPLIQDLAVAAAGELLGPRYRHLATRVYACGGAQHRIASFVYEDPLGPGTSLLERLRGRTAALDRELVLIPGGRFTMGDAPAGPLHAARVRPFLLARGLVSQGLWDSYGGEDTRRIRGRELPIHGISWDDAEPFLSILGPRLRFPSEAEWEYACRAGTTTRYPWGADLDERRVWHSGNAQRAPQRAQQHGDAMNAFGLIDMVGNLWEWTWDEFFPDDGTGPEDEQPRGDRSGDDPVPRALRGGSFEEQGADLSAARRRAAAQTERAPNFGLRIARDLDW